MHASLVQVTQYPTEPVQILENETVSLELTPELSQKVLDHQNKLRKVEEWEIIDNMGLPF